MTDDKQLTDFETALRKFTIPKLEALGTVLSNAGTVVSTTTISGTLSKEGRGLGGTLSSLTRTSIDEQPLLIPVGKDPQEGQLWRFNEKIAPKWEAKSLVDQILGENKEFRMARDKAET